LVDAQRAFRTPLRKPALPVDGETGFCWKRSILSTIEPHCDILESKLEKLNVDAQTSTARVKLQMERAQKRVLPERKAQGHSERTGDRGEKS